jgi:hypothetical protein
MSKHGAAVVKQANAVVRGLLSNAAAEDGEIRVVNAPAGAGKTGLVTRLVPVHVKKGRNVAIVTQTNEQGDDLTRRLATEQPTLSIYRLVSSQHSPENMPPNVMVVTDARSVSGSDVVVATADKWAFSAEKLGGNAFDVGIVDEAYQMPGGKLLYVANLFDSMEMVGDPGQLSPFSQVETDRWSGLAENPTKNAVDTIRYYHDLDPTTLPVTRRLPAVAAEIVQAAFYPDLAFGAATEAGERQLRADERKRPSPIDKVVDMALEHGWALATLPNKAVLRTDPELAAASAEVVKNLLDRNTVRVEDDYADLPKTIAPERIAVGVTHRDQVLSATNALRRAGLSGVAVDTANRFQGREFDVVVAWHPLSGQAEVGSFHLDVGRMCVLTTRHRHTCIVLARDGVGDLLDASVPIGEGILGEPGDRTISGWEAHLIMLDHLEKVAVSL